MVSDCKCILHLNFENFAGIARNPHTVPPVCVPNFLTVTAPFSAQNQPLTSSLAEGLRLSSWACRARLSSSDDVSLASKASLTLNSSITFDSDSLSLTRNVSTSWNQQFHLSQWWAHFIHGGPHNVHSNPINQASKHKIYKIYTLWLKNQARILYLNSYRKRALWVTYDTVTRTARLTVSYVTHNARAPELYNLP